MRGEVLRRRRWWTRRAAICGCLAALLPSAAEAAAGQPALSVRVVVRDAPVRAALEMVLTAGRADFSLDNNARGLVSADTKTAVGLDDALRAVLDGGAMHLELSVADGIYIVKPQAGSPGPRLADAPGAATAARPSPPQRSVLDVPRRLSGVVIDGGGRATHCIVETGSPGSPGHTVEVLTVNRAGGKIASGFPGEAALTVERLDAGQLVLRDSKNRKIVVPLRGLNDR